jgi:hypothetical protein
MFADKPQIRQCPYRVSVSVAGTDVGPVFDLWEKDAGF